MDLIEKLTNDVPISDMDLATIMQRLVSQTMADAPLFFLQNPTRWYATDFPVGALGEVRADIYFQPHCTLAEVADKRPEIAIENVHPQKMKGRPVLVGPKPDGPYVLIEGAHRVCSILKMDPASQRDLGAVPVIIGVCHSISSWERWSE